MLQSSAFDRLCDRPPFDARDQALIWDILHASHKLLHITRQATLDDYRADEMMQLACERLLITIGEAARKLSAEFKSGHANVAWQKIVGLREAIVRDYALDQAEVWTTIRTDVPALIRAIGPLISGDLP